MCGALRFRALFLAGLALATCGAAPQAWAQNGVIDDPPTGIDLSLSPESVPEGSDGRELPTIVEVTVTLTGGERTRSVPTTVAVSVAGGGTHPATAGATGAGSTDFRTVEAFEITIPANMSSATGRFDLRVFGDSLAEGGETVTVTGSADLGSGPVTATADLTIHDYDVQNPRVAITGGGDVGEGVGSVTLTARLINPVPGGFTVDVSTIPRTGSFGATAGEDYSAIPVPATLGFTGTHGEGQTFTVAITDDSDVEGYEGFYIALSGLGGTARTVGISDRAFVSIIDNDGPPRGIELSISPEWVPEGSDGSTVTTMVEVTATLTGGERTRAVPTTVEVSVAGGGGNPATGGERTAGSTDFVTVEAFEITIPANMSSATGRFNLEVVGDMRAEGEEIVKVSGSADLGSGPVTATADLTITDYDPESPRVFLHQGLVGEGAGSVTLTAELINPVPGGFTVHVSSFDHRFAYGAISGEDYSGIWTRLSFAGTHREKQTFTVAITDDSDVEGDETFRFRLGDLRGTARPVDISDFAQVIIVDDDDPPYVDLRGGGDVGEGVGSVTLTAVLMGSSVPGGFTVDVSTIPRTDGIGATATAGEDYSAIPVPATLGFTGTHGEVQTFTVAITDDSDVERDETFYIVSSGRGGTARPVGISIVQVIIVDDDGPPTGIELSISPEWVPEGSDGSTVTTMVEVTATLMGGARTRAVPTTVEVSVAGGGGNPATGGERTAGSTDFVTVEAFEITIPANMSSATGRFNLEVVGDMRAEGEEIVKVSGSADLGSGPVTATADLTITDYDPESPRVFLHQGLVWEGAGSVTLTAELINPVPGGSPSLSSPSPTTRRTRRSRGRTTAGSGRG